MQEQQPEGGSVFAFQIEDIMLIESTIGPITEDIPKEITYNCKLQINHQVNLSTGKVDMAVAITIDRTDTEQQLAKIGIGCSYQIENIEKIPLVEERLPKECMQQLNADSIATARGIFYMLVKGTYLRRAIIPVVPQQTYITSQV